MIEQMNCNEILNYLTDLDNKYHKALPDINALAKLYSDVDCPKLYRQRDLQWKWQRAHIKKHELILHDVTDERNCGALRR